MVLQKDYKNAQIGKLDLYEIGMEHDATYPSMKLMVIQALFGAQRDGCWNESLLSKMEAAFSMYGIDIQEKGYVLTKEELAIAMLEYQNIPFKKWTNFLEQNPWVAESMNVMALAVIAYAQSGGKSQDSEEPEE